MPFKAVLFFRQFNQGWTETWYLLGIPDLLAWARGNFGNPDWVVGWRHADTILDSVRVSNLAVRRQAILYPVPPGTAQIGRVPPAIPPTPDVVYTTALYRIWASGYQPLRHVWLRGLNDDDVIRDSVSGTSTPAGPLKQGADSYVRAWQGLGAQIQVLPALPGPGLPQQTITRVAANVDGVHTDLTFAGGVPPSVGTSIVIAGIDQRLAPGLQGTFTVLAVAGQIVTVNYTPAFAAPFSPFAGRWRSKAPGYVGITGYEFLRFSQRDTGRPTVPSRGRRRSVRRRS